MSFLAAGIPWSNEDPLHPGSADSDYGSGLNPQNDILQTNRDVGIHPVILWKYEVPEDTKVVAQSLLIHASPGGAWACLNGNQSLNVGIGNVAVLVDGNEVCRFPVRYRGAHEVVTGSAARGAGNSVTGYGDPLNYQLLTGGFLELDEGQLVQLYYHPAQPWNVATVARPGSCYPSVLRASFLASTPSGQILVVPQVNHTVRDSSTTQLIFEHEAEAGGMRLNALQVWADGNQVPWACRWMVLRINGEIIHEFLDATITPLSSTRDPMHIPLWGTTFYPGDLLELVGHPQTDTGGMISASLVGESLPYIRGPQFLMRGFSTADNAHVYWESETPDPAGSSSGRDPSDLDDIVVIQSVPGE